MKPSRSLAALVAAIALSACGGADVASTSAEATIACTTRTLTEVFTTDCSTTAGLDTAVCLAGPPPVCSAGAGAGCACTGEGTNLWAAVGAVGLCGRNAEQTRESLQSKLCGLQVLIAKGDVAAACDQIRAFESDVLAKQAKLNKDIQYADANALRKAAQAIEAAIDATGTRCRNATKLVP